MGYFSHVDDGVGGKGPYGLFQPRSPLINVRIEWLQFPEIKGCWRIRGENPPGPENE